MNVSEETSARGRKRRSRVSRVRKMVLAGAFVLFCIGVVAVGGMGDACSVGYEAIAMVCPLGALEGFFGSWSFVPRMALGLVLALAVVLIAGRAFCSWICPVPPLQGFLRTKKQRQRDAVERKAQAEDSLALWKSSCSGCKGDSCGDACAQASGADGRGSSAQPLSARGNVGSTRAMRCSLARWPQPPCADSPYSACCVRWGLPLRRSSHFTGSSVSTNRPSTCLSSPPSSFLNWFCCGSGVIASAPLARSCHSWLRWPVVCVHR